MAPKIGAATRWTWDVTGAGYDMGEYLAGTPECWLQTPPLRSKPGVDVQMDSFLSCAVDPYAMKLRGAATVALTLALQQAGYAVRVSAALGFRTTAGARGRQIWARVILSDDRGGPLDTDRLLFMLAHPAAVRWLQFVHGSIVAGHDHDAMTQEVYGAPTGMHNPFATAETVSVPSMILGHGDWSSPAACERWVAETFARITART